MIRTTWDTVLAYRKGNRLWAVLVAVAVGVICFNLFGVNWAISSCLGVALIVLLPAAIGVPRDLLAGRPIRQLS